MDSMAVALPMARDPVNNADTAKDALGIERGEGGMSGALSLNGAVAEITSAVLAASGRCGDIGSPTQAPLASAVDRLGPAWD